MTAHHRKFWTDKRKERALSFALGTAILIIIILLLRKHLTGSSSSPFSFNPTISPQEYNLSPVFNINGGAVTPYSLEYHPGDFSVAYPILAGGVAPAASCGCGCNPADSQFTNYLTDNLNKYSQAIAVAENYYIDNVFGNLAPAMQQFIGNKDFTTVSPSNFGG